MKIILFLLLFLLPLFADFYLEGSHSKIKMSELKNGKVDLSLFRKMAKIEPQSTQFTITTNKNIKDKKNLHFRLVEVFPKHMSSLVTRKIDTKKYLVDASHYNVNDAEMLQLFYKGKWYGIVLGRPIKVLHKIFQSVDMKEKDLDIKKLSVLIKEARAAFPLDDKLKTIEMELNNKLANQFNRTSNHMQQGIIF